MASAALRDSKAAPAASQPFLSVGSKLAGATIALIVLVACGVYVGLSRYQGESLLRSKEVAAAAVSRLFADSCAAAVVFNDDSAINDAVVLLGRNEEVDWAGVFGVTPKAGVVLGELKRGSKEPPPPPTSAMRVERRGDRVVVTSPILNPEGTAVAVSVIAFSLTREHEAISAVQSRMLWVSAGVAIGLTLLLLSIARFAIVRPLGKLVHAAGELEKGTPADVDITSSDEIGQLANAFRSMATAIRQREERIRARNSDMRLVLDNVGQGFISIDLDGNMSEERSRVVEEWFGKVDGTPHFWDYLKQTDAVTGEVFKLGWAAVLEDIMPLELCLDQLPKTVHIDERTFEFAYRPIMTGDRLHKTIVVITDVTSRIERERAELAQRQLMNLFRRITSDRSTFETFFEEASVLVRAIVNPEAGDLGLLKRQIHTLKGNCALFGIESVAIYCHDLETLLAESLEFFGDKERKTLSELWDEIGEMRGRFTQGDAGRVEIEVAEYEAFLRDLRDERDVRALAAVFVSWRYEPVSRRLALIADQIKLVSDRLGKVPVDVEFTPSMLRLPPRKWAPFWSAFSHVIRNAVDHGLETPEERADAGKSPRGTVTLSIAEEGEHVIVTIRDDGRGIEWDKIKERAISAGFAHQTQRDLEEALFAEGISARSDVSMESGRGVGLGAVREVVRHLGGSIALHSELGRGTTFRFSLPRSMLLENAVSQRPAA